jgi:murein DD-endopeptidase MepM/ murein hydrolase activator NlpD
LRIRELQRANGITSDALDVGQALRVRRLSAPERAPRLRRRTRRHLFQRDALTDATTNADGAWRRWRWRYEPRGGDAREFFSRRVGVGRSDALNGDARTDFHTDRADARNAAMRSVSFENGDERQSVEKALAWEDRRPRRGGERQWHPRFAAPLRARHDAFVTSGFGWRWGRLHAGVDLAANEGTPVRASARGVVVERVFDAGGYGWLLRVAHGEGWETRYAHCRAVDDLGVGARVRRGQKVAEVGNTGRSFGPHLHFEVRRNGVPVDPLTCTDA